MKKDLKGDFLQALVNHNFKIGEACLAVGIHRSTYDNWCKEDSLFKESVHEIKELQKDIVEGKLFDLVQAGNVTATIFWLKAQAKERDWNEKPAATNKESAATGENIPFALPNPNDTKEVRKRVKNKHDYLVKMLKQQGKYAPELSGQVDVVARLMLRVEDLGAIVMSPDYQPVLTQYSREGDIRQTANPLETLYQNSCERLQKALKALGMNTDAKERKADNDHFSDFLASFKDDDD